MTRNVPAGSRIRQARLSGPSTHLDRRINAYRPDLADSALADVVVAARYVDPVRRQCKLPVVMLHAAANAASTATSALLYGETFDVFETIDGWAWGRCVHDSYVGWLNAGALVATGTAATHRVATAAALVFARPDIKSPLVMRLPLGARCVAHAAERDFWELPGTGFVHRRHILPIDEPSSDPVEVAQGFIGSPYLWGGRTRDGIDCSGLTQAAMLDCGVACPRDSDQQGIAVGVEVSAEARRRGDLVFFPGHVGLLVDHEQLLHANAFWMTTLLEPLAAVIERLASLHARPVLAIRRPPLAPVRADK